MLTGVLSGFEGLCPCLIASILLLDVEENTAKLGVARAFSIEGVLTESSRNEKKNGKIKSQNTTFLIALIYNILCSDS